MSKDELVSLDVDHAVLTGAIIERQKHADTGEWKYLIRGFSLDEDDIVVVTKKGSEYESVVITVYRES